MPETQTAALSPTLNDDLSSDLAYVRSLAEEGAHAPLVSGRYFLSWGMLMGAASLFVYLVALDVIAIGPIGYIAPWVVASVAGWIMSFTFCARVWTKPGASTLGNRTASAVWFSIGIMMTLFFVTIYFTHDRYVSDGVPAYFMFSMLFPIAFGAYGVAFYATATAARTAWLKGFAALSWGFSFVSFFLMASPHQFLVGGLGILACAALPGIVLMMREPSEMV